MLKRIFFVIAASLLMLGAVGCACSGGIVSPSPTASMRPVATPEATQSTPALDAGANASASPGVSSSPDANAGANAGAAGGAAATIPNFAEGTEVKPEDAPAIKSAIEAKYSGAVIKSIKHATRDSLQVYAVEIERNGKTETVHVQPDGTILPEGTAAP